MGLDDFDSRVLAPGEAGYAETVTGFNLAVRHQPDRVVTVSGLDEVVAALRYARRADLQVSVFATGHGWTESVTGGLMVNTSGLQQLEIDPVAQTATVGAGVRWQQVIEAAAPYGLAPLNGSSVTVGAVGYTLGGGMGPMARTFGFAADYVLSIEVVTPDGEVRVIDRDREPELFWGLRGGRPRVGVVTAMTFRLMPVARFYGGATFFAGEHAATVMRTWREWSRSVPDSVSTSIALLRLPDLPEIPEPIRGRLSVHLRYVHVGDPARGAELVGPMRACAPVLMDDVVDRPYAQIAAVHMDPTDPIPAWDRGCLLSDLPDPAIEALLATAGPGVDVPLILAEVRLLGGALATNSADNAAGGRNAAYSTYVVGPIPPELAEVTPMVGSAVIEALRPWQAGTSLINFQGTGCPETERGTGWTDSTPQRLAALTECFDPEARMWCASRISANVAPA